MSGPKHLWSGDWQRESDAASSSRAHRAPQRDEPQPPTEKLRPRRRRRLTGTGLIVGVAVLVLAGAAFGLSALLSGSPARHRAAASAPTASTIPGAPAVPTLPIPQPQTTPQTQTQTNPQTTPVAATPVVNWLGMEIATEQPGAAVVQTVTIGTPADKAGINPGEVIQAINGKPITSARDIVAALHGLNRGDQVTLQLVYGSGSSQAHLTLGAPPSVVP